MADSARHARARSKSSNGSNLSETLRAHQGNITQAARWAGQDRRAFGRLVKRHNIDRGSA